MRRRTLTGLSVLIVILALGCSPEQPADTTAEDDSARAGGSQGAEQAPLAESATRMFGLPVPEVLELLEAGDDTARYETDVDPLRLVSFYEDALIGYHVEPWPDGLKFVAGREGRPDVYLLPSAEGTDVYYFRAPIDLPDVELADASSGEPGRGAPVVPRGVIAPQEIIDRLRPNPSGGGRHYTGRLEQQGDEMVRVLTLRPQGEGNVPAADEDTEPLFPEHWHRSPRRPTGSYDRGDGHGSLRATRAAGPDGRELPFMGDQRLAPDEPTGH